ncbi:MAG: hypothetical protein EOO39_04455 [Cytophagaceae bacterium]|nr:MAG: hypothetical protein EOO39_04455 [Cytophagaceae bacterium]
MLVDTVLLDRNQVLDSLRELPEKVSFEDLLERLLFIKLIEERLQEQKEVTNSVVMQELQELRQQKMAALQK